MTDVEALRAVVEEIAEMISHEKQMADWLGERKCWEDAADKIVLAGHYELVRLIVKQRLTAAEERQEKKDG